MAKKTLEEQIEGFLEIWTMDHQVKFIQDLIPLLEMFNVEEGYDWVEEEVGKENVVNVRLIKVVMVMSKIIDSYSGTFARAKIEYKDLHRRIGAIGL
jgi:hypothetical protein